MGTEAGRLTGTENLVLVQSREELKQMLALAAERAMVRPLPSGNVAITWPQVAQTENTKQIWEP